MFKKNFKAGFPKVGDITPLGAILVSRGALTSKGANGGDFTILGSHKIFTFYLIILLIFSLQLNTWPWGKTLTRKVYFVYVKYSEKVDKNIEFFRKRRDEKTKQCKITKMFKKFTLSIEDGQLAFFICLS